MSVCVFDNPRNCRREAWQDKKLVADMDMGLLYHKFPPGGRPVLFFGLSYGGKDFIDGKIWYGTVDALPDELQTYVRN